MADGLFVYKAKRTYDGDRVMLHLQGWWHGWRGRAFICHVHKPCGENVVLMMPKSYLVEAIGLRKGEECLAAIPCTKETVGLSLVSALVKLTVQYVKLNAKGVAERLKKTAVSLIRYVVHDDMGRLNLYGWTEDA